MKKFVILLTLLFSQLAAAVSLQNAIVFGDSLSDNGNLWEYMERRVPISPPYYKGHFSDGPVWVEYLMESFYPRNSRKHLIDFAFGGAGISEENDDSTLFTLKHEVDVYLLAHQKASPNSLFIVWIGANNYLALPDEVESTVIRVTQGINKELERLAQSGAKYVLVVNLPDLGKTPMAREFDAEEQLSTLTLEHNKALNNAVTLLKAKYPNVTWISFDAHESLDNIIAEPAKYGFTNATDTCYEAMIDKPSQQFLVKMAARKPAFTFQSNCRGYVFFDPVHATARTHSVMAQQVRDLLKRNGIVFK